MSNEIDPVQRRKVIAAARTAASWARARRATWTEQADATYAAPAADAEAHVQAETTAAADAPAVDRSVDVVPSGPSATDRLADWMRAALAPAARWLPRLAIGALVVAAFAAAVAYGWKWASTSRAATPSPAQTRPERPTASAKSTGALRVKSTPPGAQVTVDGRPRGVTPLTLDDLTPGRHTVRLESAEGTIERTIAIAGGETASLDEAIFAGWVVVYSPFDLSISEGERALRPDDRNQIMLPAGPHDLQLVNRALGYDEVRHVDLKPGEIVRVSVTPPRSTITVTAADAAEVWIDGKRAGDAPLEALPIDLGTHDVAIRRAGTERRFTVTVTTKPFTLNVDK
jgi:PEGA domain-containing protein